MSTVILGGGIIGLSTAYYLSLSRVSSTSSSSSSPAATIHIIDSSPALLASASGFAGGFLAADWFSPPLASLGALSFRLHRELAQKHDGPRKWGYAGSQTFNLSVDERAAAAAGKKERSGDWLREGTSRADAAAAASSSSSTAEANGGGGDGGVLNADGSPAVWTPQPGGTLETISGPESCAQIEARELCEFLLDECRKRGVQVHLSTRATGILTDANGGLRGLKLRSTSSSSTEQVEESSSELECNDVLISVGAWAPRVFQTLFPSSKLHIPVEPLAGHSIVVKSPRYQTPFVDAAKRNLGGSDNWLCYAIYCAPGRHWSYAPEAFARLARNGETEIWLGGLNDSALPLPERASDVKAMIDPDSIASLRKMAVQLTGRLAEEGDQVNQDDLETVREGLCFRPVSQKGTPVLGRIPEHSLGLRAGGASVWIASGHGPWGISLSLGTGLVMSEMILGEKPSADIRALLIA